jgi:hypothetical protein
MTPQQSVVRPRANHISNPNTPDSAQAEKFRQMNQNSQISNQNNQMNNNSQTLNQNNQMNRNLVNGQIAQNRPGQNQVILYHISFSIIKQIVLPRNLSEVFD